MIENAPADFSQYKLGRKAIVTDTRNFKLRRYLTPALPSPPDSHSWMKGVTSFGMMGNDTLSDCICAASGHAVQVWTMNSGTEKTLSDATIENAYISWCGYQPGNESTDNGGVILNCLKDWQKNGLGGIPLDAFMTTTPGSTRTIQQAIMMFGFVMIGMALPITAQTQAVWDYVPGGGANSEPGSWGNHCVIVPAFDGDVRTVHHFSCISWGQVIPMTKSFWMEYVDEAYTLVSSAWPTATKQARGFDAATLLSDRKAVR
jgi:hypothetical protein